MEFTEFWTLCSSNGIMISKPQIEQLQRYIRELLYWNAQVNLISRADEENVLEKHILHSLSVLKFIDLKPKSRCLDVGTGGGLPGIPLAIVCEGSHFLLIDSIAKKIKMTEMFAKHTGIKTLSALTSRAEELAKQKRYEKSFDFIFSRAVAKTFSVLGWVEPMLKPNGKVVLYKGGDLTDEIEQSEKSYPNYEFSVIPIKLFGTDTFEADDKKFVLCSRKKN